jgi:hypothetical protein
MRLLTVVAAALLTLAITGCAAGDSDDDLELPVDLRFGGTILVSPGNPVVGETLQILVPIRNHGSYAAPASAMRVTVNGSITTEVAVPVIPAYANVVAASLIAGLPVGAHTVLITLDAHQQVFESDETDNQQAGVIIVSLPVSGTG